MEWIVDYNPDYPHRVEWNGKLCYSRPPVAIIFTDACEWQRGGWVEATAEHPAIDRALPFDDVETHEHITLQETAAAADSIVGTVLERGYSNVTPMARIDATEAVRYIRCLGGRKASFTGRIIQMQLLLRERHIQLLAGHVKGAENPSDAPSRGVLGLAEYSLNRQYFNHLQRPSGPFGLDACAASWNCQLPRCLSRQKGDAKALGHDILCYPLQHEEQVMYIFPPMQPKLVLQILKRITAAKAEAVLVLPLWTTAVLTEALKMTVDVPVVLGCSRDLLQPPAAYEVHLGGQLAQWWTRPKWKALIGLRLSGDAGRVADTRARWQGEYGTCTSKGEMAATLIGRTVSWWPVSNDIKPKVTELARLCCQIWSYAT